MSDTILHLTSGSHCTRETLQGYLLKGRDFAKAVVDLSQREMIIGVSMHVDAEQMFLQNDSSQENLRGVNLYPDAFATDDFIEYDSMINIRPRQNNRSRYVEDETVRKQIADLVLSFFA